MGPNCVGSSVGWSGTFDPSSHGVLSTRNIFSRSLSQEYRSTTALVTRKKHSLVHKEDEEEALWNCHDVVILLNNPHMRNESIEKECDVFIATIWLVNTVKSRTLISNSFSYWAPLPLGRPGEGINIAEQGTLRVLLMHLLYWTQWCFRRSDSIITDEGGEFRFEVKSLWEEHLQQWRERVRRVTLTQESWVAKFMWLWTWLLRLRNLNRISAHTN